MTTSPPKPHNFDSTIEVAHLDEYWHRKYEEVEEGHGLKQVATYDEVMAAEVPDADIHMPSPSYWPIVIAFGLPIIAAGVIFNLWLAVIGGLIVFGGIYGLALEPATAPDAPGDDHGGDGHDDHEPDGPDAQTADGDDRCGDRVPDDHEAVAVD